MKAQAEIVTFVLLFLVGVTIFVAATTWGKSISDKNLDVAKITASETFMKKLDSAVQSVVKFGGSQTINYNLNSPIELTDSGLDDSVKILLPITTDIIPNYRVPISSPGAAGLIEEWRDNSNFRIELKYPLQVSTAFAIDLFTEGSKAATPRQIVVDKNSTYTTMISGTQYTVAKIRLRFQ